MRLGVHNKKVTAEDIQFFMIIFVFIIGGAVLNHFGKMCEPESDYLQLREMLPVDIADTVAIKNAGVFIKDESAIIWYVTGKENEEHYYLPIECCVTDYSNYQFIQEREAIATNIRDIVYTPFYDGYVFLINNRDCVGFEAVNTAGEKYSIKIEDDSNPHIVFSYDISSCKFLIKSDE